MGMFFTSLFTSLFLLNLPGPGSGPLDLFLELLDLFFELLGPRPDRFVLLIQFLDLSHGPLDLFLELLDLFIEFGLGPSSIVVFHYLKFRWREF